VAFVNTPDLDLAAAFKALSPGMPRAQKRQTIRDIERKVPIAQAFSRSAAHLPGRAHWTAAGRTIRAGASSASEATDEGVSNTELELHDLMVRGLAGDAGAHRRLLECLGGLFRTFFRGRMRADDASQIEDLVQETLIAIHTRRDTYDAAQPLRAWVYAIARYKLIDHLRRKKTTGVAIPVDEVTSLFSSDETNTVDAVHDVTALLDQLPAKQRAAIRLVKLEELSIREAAARTGMSESDVKISIHRGMKKLSALAAKGRNHDD
jgi:RNA polymerase sigma-70 factor (ECF subfamily)